MTKRQLLIALMLQEHAICNHYIRVYSDDSAAYQWSMGYINSFGKISFTGGTLFQKTVLELEEEYQQEINKA